MRVNEIFYSLQGEGAKAGTPAVFIRLSGCNQKCDFCDTDHQSATEMTEQEIVNEALCHKSRHAVITGGEPCLQLNATLVNLLVDEGFDIQIETNGSIDLPREVLDDISWITCSPKDAEVKISRIDELKVVYRRQDMSRYDHLIARKPKVLSLQPCDTGDASRNHELLKATIAYILENPTWRLSLQQHKLLDIR